MNTRSPRKQRLLLALLGVLAVIVSTGCEAVFDVDVTVEEDGSGRVDTVLRLDAELAEQILDLDVDVSGLALTDLARSGWDIGRIEKNPDGSVVIPASKEFGEPEQFYAVMGDLSGGTGLFDSFVFIRGKSFGEVAYTVRGNLDPSGGFESFVDPSLERDLGVPIAELIEHYGADGSSMTVNVEVEMPGVVQASSPAGIVATVDGITTGRWSTDLGAPEPTLVEVSAATTNTMALVLRGVSVVTAALAAVVVLARLLRILRPDRRKKAPPPRRPAKPSTTSTPKSGPADKAPADSPVAPEVTAPIPAGSDPEPYPGSEYAVVAVDGMGVLYREGNDIQQLLIPFVRERGATALDQEIVAKVRRLSLGRMTTADFWQWVGIEGDAESLDSAYISRHQLSPGIVRYLRGLRDANTKVACITNDGLGWANRLRAAHSLDGIIDPWVVSGSIGVRKPDPPIYELLRRLTGEDPASILIVDDRIVNLDAARKLGFATALFQPDGDLADANGHMLIRSFEAGSPLLRSGVVGPPGQGAPPPPA